MKEKNIFIVGSNGIPANYGGFETFVENLTAKRVSDKIKYHVSCLTKDNEEVEYNGARCFHIKVPNIGHGKAVYYDMISLERTIKYIKQKQIPNATVYVLGTTIGILIGHYKKRLKKLQAKLYVNPDGCEWKRKKWNDIIRKYLKMAERKMVKHADLVICDSIHIQHYIKEEYQKYQPNTTFIAYGSDVQEQKLEIGKETYENWCQEKQVKPNEYYLIVGRFVPENNYETMLTEFIKVNTKKDLVIVTDVEQNKFYETLKQKTNFEQDKRIKFVGTIYDTNLLTQIRKNAYGYFHGHEVGGTNPSLLEALATTKLNLLLDVGFNQEVAKDSSLYWNKEEGNLSTLISKVENFDQNTIEQYGKKAKQRIKESYNWEKIVQQYEKLFLSKIF